MEVVESSGIKYRGAIKGEVEGTLLQMDARDNGIGLSDDSSEILIEKVLVFSSVQLNCPMYYLNKVCVCVCAPRI